MVFSNSDTNPLADARAQRALHSSHAAHPLDELDLRTIRLLLLLLESSSLSSAAAETGVSPSTASKILQKTRALFDDPLFVRSGGRMLPTERMRELAPGFVSALRTFANLAEPSEPFSPARASGQLRIAAADNAAASLFLPALPHLLDSAPNLTFSFEAIETTLLEQLREGTLDFAILMDRALEIHPAYHCQQLLTSGHFLLMRAEHPLVRVARERSLEASDLEPYRRAAFSRNNPSGGHYLDVLAHTPSRAADAVLFPQILTAGLALMQTDLVLTCPEPTARILAQTTGLFMTSDPERGDCPWTPVLLWHERTHRSPVHVWVRSQLLHYAERWGEG